MNNYNTSRVKLQESSKCLAGGVSSSLRASMKPTPLFAQSASGVRIRDVDGNEYLDYLLAYGPLILGHANPALTERIHNAMVKGYTYGLQHEGEIELAERLVEILPAVDKVAFSGSGTEAVMLALRLARAYTGKQKIIRFHGHYHGWSDAIFTSFPSPDMKNDSAPTVGLTEILPGTGGQSLNSINDIIMLPWNDPQALEQALKLHQHELAAVIMEPVMCNSGCIEPREGYLEFARKWTEQLGIVLIFDEVITGFRMSLGGAHGRFGIYPDLVTMGKAIAGGVSLSVVGGKEEIMKLITTGQVSHLGTVNGNCIAIAAALATIEELSKDEGKIFDQMEKIAQQLVVGIRELFVKHQIKGLINQIGPVFHIMFIDQLKVADFETFQLRDAGKYVAFAEQLLNEGILVRNSGLWYVSTLHRETEVQETLGAIDRALTKVFTFAKLNNEQE